MTINLDEMKTVAKIFNIPVLNYYDSNEKITGHFIDLNMIPSHWCIDTYDIDEDDEEWNRGR